MPDEPRKPDRAVTANGAVLGFADPDTRLGFGFVCNRAGKSWRDPRNIALIDAVYESL